MKLNEISDFLRSKDTYLKPSEHRQLLELIDRMCKNEERYLRDIKNRADHQFRSGNYEQAYDLYTEYLSAYKDDPIILSNRAAASYKLERHDNVINDCKLAISLRPNFLKAYLRMGLAYLSLGDVDSARSSFEDGLKIDPNNKILKGQCENLKKAEENTSLNVNGSLHSKDRIDEDYFNKACRIAKDNDLKDAEQIENFDGLKDIIKDYLEDKSEEEKNKFFENVVKKINSD